MNLLLLLSALLSALTGVGASARAPERAQAVAVVGVGRTAKALAPAHVASRPVSTAPRLAAVAALGIVLPVLVRDAPRWTDRRRE